MVKQRLLSTEHEVARRIKVLKHKETAQQTHYRDICCTNGPLQFQELSLLCSLADDVVLANMCLCLRLLVINMYVCLSHTKKVLNRRFDTLERCLCAAIGLQ